MKYEIDMLINKLDNITDDNVKVEKSLLLSHVYNGFVGILTDKGRVDENVEDAKNLPSSKGLEYSNPFDEEQHISPNSDYEIISEK